MIVFYSEPPIFYKYNLIKFSKLNNVISNYNCFFKYFIDCGVMEFAKNGEYNLKKYEYINWNEIPNNFVVNIPDYPQDIRKLKKNENIIRTFRNQKYFLENYEFDRFVPTLQFEMENIESFKENFYLMVDLIKDYKIAKFGIGNLCKCRNLAFYKEVFAFLSKYQHKYDYHIFGCWLKAINKIFLKDFENFSFDNTAWTRACNNTLMNHSCKKGNERKLFFYTYLDVIYNKLGNVFDSGFLPQFFEKISPVSKLEKRLTESNKQLVKNIKINKKLGKKELCDLYKKQYYENVNDLVILKQQKYKMEE